MFPDRSVYGRMDIWYYDQAAKTTVFGLKDVGSSRAESGKVVFLAGISSWFYTFLFTFYFLPLQFLFSSLAWLLLLFVLRRYQVVPFAFLCCPCRLDFGFDFSFSQQYVNHFRRPFSSLLSLLFFLGIRSNNKATPIYLEFLF